MAQITIENWIISNLKCYGNSLIPNQLIDSFGKKDLEEALCQETGLEIVIKEKILEEEDDYYEDDYLRTSRKKTNKIKTKVVNYFAEEVKSSNSNAKNKNKDVFSYKKEYVNEPVKEQEKKSKGVNVEDLLTEIMKEALSEDDSDNDNQEEEIIETKTTRKKEDKQIKSKEKIKQDKEVEAEDTPRIKIKESRMSRNKLTDLNDHLFEQLERLNDDELTEEQLNKEINRSKAMQDIAKQIIDNSRVQVEVTKLMIDYGDINEINGKNMSKLLPMIETKDK